MRMIWLVVKMKYEYEQEYEQVKKKSTQVEYYL